MTEGKYTFVVAKQANKIEIAKAVSDIFKVKVENDRRFKTGQVDSYIQQKPGSRTPMLYVYNWSG